MRLRAILCIALAAGCGGASETPATTAPPAAALRVAGRTFEIVAVDGQALPANVLVGGRSSCNAVPAARIVVSFYPYGELELRIYPGGSVFRIPFSQTSDGTITVTDASAGNASHFLRDTLHLALQPFPLCQGQTFVGVVTVPP